MDYKPITLTLPDTPEMRQALQDLASRPSPMVAHTNSYAFLGREIARQLAWAPEPVDPPLHDGGGDQP